MSSETDAQFGIPTDVGSRLRAAREAKHLSLREIANTTKISIGALEALEENDIARLPGGIFTRGFVRSYGAEVGLDPEQTMRDFMAQLPAEGVGEGTEDDWPHKHDPFENQQRRAGRVLTLALVAVPVGALLFFFGIRGVPSDTRTPAASATAVESEPPPPSSLDRSVRVDPPTPISAPQAPLTIVLRPRGDCWVSLRLDGESALRRVMHAGERVAYEADDEIVLNVGDAGAFAFAINQQRGRSLGASGEVVTVTITLQNYRGFVVP